MRSACGREWAAIALASAWAGCGGDPDRLGGLSLVGADLPGGPIPGLSAAWAERFDLGDALFEAPFREVGGLGPVYIRTSCAACHEADARGPGIVEKFALVEADGATPAADQSALAWGHTRRPYAAGGAETPIEVPDVPGLLVTDRAPNPVFGRGYLEAVDEAEVLRVAAEQGARGDAITGRPNRVAWTSEPNPDARFHGYGPGDVDILGRFALKARIATLDDFAADALQGDMSITSPLRPTELPNPDGLTDDLSAGVDADLDAVNLLGDYVRLLAIPDRDPVQGIDLFDAIGCAACHTPSMRTRADHPIPQLAGIDAPIYTDLLVHDMGRDAADGLVDGQASTSEWRTAPLIGMRFLRSYLHDGRADTVEHAIEGHRGPGSEANDVIDAFDALSETERAVLVGFVEAL